MNDQISVELFPRNLLSNFDKNFPNFEVFSACKVAYCELATADLLCKLDCHSGIYKDFDMGIGSFCGGKAGLSHILKSELCSNGGKNSRGFSANRIFRNFFRNASISTNDSAGTERPIVTFYTRIGSLIIHLSDET